MLSVSNTIVIPRSEFQLSLSRFPSPGKRNVNKVNSKVTLRWNIREAPSLPPAIKHRFLARLRNRITKEGQLILTSHRDRDQHRYLAAASDKLRQLILTVAEPQKNASRSNAPKVPTENDLSKSDDRPTKSPNDEMSGSTTK